MSAMTESQCHINPFVYISQRKRYTHVFCLFVFVLLFGCIFLYFLRFFFIHIACFCLLEICVTVVAVCIQHTRINKD